MSSRDPDYLIHRTKDLPFCWRCPNCNKLNFGVHTVTSSAPGYHTVFKANEDSRRALVEEQADDILDQRALDAILCTENRRFDLLNFRYRCTQCREIPPWSRLPQVLPEWFITIRFLCLAVSLLLIGFILYTDKYRTMVYPFLGVSGGLYILLFAAGSYKVHRTGAKVASAVSRLPAGSVPVMAKDRRELLLRLLGDGLITAAEARENGLSARDQADASKLISASYAREAKQLKTRLFIRDAVIAVIVAAALGIFVYSQCSRVRNAQAPADTETAVPTAADAGAVSAFMIRD